jgi:LDH2 family malate/lactate/ureidoglycolate dehydrogenase
MARYPTNDAERRIHHNKLRRTVAQLFHACDMSEQDAGLLADTLTTADLRGIHSHGVMRVPDYVGKILDLGVNPKAQPVVTSDKAAALVVDGKNGMGQIGSVFSMQQAIARARDVNVALVALGGSNHCGAMDYYVRMAVEQNMIGLAGTNALPTMAPWGGIDKIVGLNPVAIGFPAGEVLPVILDVALGATAHGKIEIYHQKGEAIPPDWAFDIEGRPTTDASKALDGLIQPIAAFKGIGLAVCVGLLSTLLSGASYGTESGNMIDGPISGADGQFFMAINISAFTELNVFKSRMDSIVREFNNSRRSPGVDSVYMPGALEAQIEQEYRAEGIPLAEPTLEGLFNAAQRLGMTILQDI